MDQVWITRLGIVLCLVGGFLVTPETIGKKKITVVQDLLYDFSGYLRDRFRKADGYAMSEGEYLMPILMSIIPLFIDAMLMVFIIIGCISLINIFFQKGVFVLAFFLLGPLFVWFANTSLDDLFQIPKILILPAIILYVIGVPFWLLLGAIFRLFSFLFERIYCRLMRKQVLIKAMTRLGIITLIVGSILQMVTAK